MSVTRLAVVVTHPIQYYAPLWRALAGEPKLILADEPTANLDSQRSQEIVALLAELAHERGASVLLVTHDAQAGAAAGRTLGLRDGRLDESVAESRS